LLQPVSQQVVLETKGHLEGAQSG